MNTREWEIDSYTPTVLPEAGVQVYHDGDEEAVARLGDEGWLSLGATSGTWQVMVVPAYPPKGVAR